jgi:hypothetical protein
MTMDEQVRSRNLEIASNVAEQCQFHAFPMPVRLSWLGHRDSPGSDTRKNQTHSGYDEVAQPVGPAVTFRWTRWIAAGAAGSRTLPCALTSTPAKKAWRRHDSRTVGMLRSHGKTKRSCDVDESL